MMPADTLDLPATITDDFGQPDAWAACTVSIAELPPGTHWRTLAYTSALRALEAEIGQRGYDLLSGEWRLYEFDHDLMAIETDECRSVVVVARALVKS
jgi:hypothetical protein